MTDRSRPKLPIWVHFMMWFAILGGIGIAALTANPLPAVIMIVAGWIISIRVQNRIKKGSK